MLWFIYGSYGIYYYLLLVSVLLLEHVSMSEDFSCSPIRNHDEVKAFLPNCLEEGKWCETNISFLALVATRSRIQLCFFLFPWCCPISCLYLIFPIWQ